MADYGSARKNQYFVPGDGIHREVITADICKYLDNDATVRPMTYQGREGYMLYAYRNLTSAMVDDLKRDSAAWEREKQKQRDRQGGGSSHGSDRHRTGGSSRGSGAPTAPEYVDSSIHAMRQATGPTIPRNGAPASETSSPGMAGDYTHARPPPPPHGSYRDPGQAPFSPQHDMPYGIQSPQAGLPQPSARESGYTGRDTGYAPGHPSGPGTSSQPRGMQPPPPGYGGGGYEFAEPGYNGHSTQPQSSMAPRDRYYPQPPATAPPVSQRGSRPGDSHFPDTRMTGRPETRDPYPPARETPRYPVESSRPERGYDQPRGYSDRDRRYGR